MSDLHKATVTVSRHRCSDCPPIGYPTDATRCEDCDRHLKGCPFCGGDAEVMSNDAKGTAWVQCSRCLGQSGGFQETERSMHVLRDLAAAEWNRRAPTENGKG